MSFGEDDAGRDLEEPVRDAMKDHDETEADDRRGLEDAVRERLRQHDRGSEPDVPPGGSA
jgi:hypothetical protein